MGGTACRANCNPMEPWEMFSEYCLRTESFALTRADRVSHKKIKKHNNNNKKVHNNGNNVKMNHKNNI